MASGETSQDRPRGMLPEIWFATFDLKIARVADHLEQGLSLSQALALEPGVVPRDVFMAAKIGEVLTIPFSRPRLFLPPLSCRFG